MRRRADRAGQLLQENEPLDSAEQEVRTAQHIHFAWPQAPRLSACWLLFQQLMVILFYAGVGEGVGATTGKCSRDAQRLPNCPSRSLPRSLRGICCELRLLPGSWCAGQTRQSLGHDLGNNSYALGHSLGWLGCASSFQALGAKASCTLLWQAPSAHVCCA